MDEDETLAEESAPDTDAAGSDAPDPAATIEDALARLATIEAKIDAGFAQLAERIDASVAVAVENGGSVGEPVAAIDADGDGDADAVEALSIDDLDFNLGKDDD